jgi:peroxiredoxin Q/BCP
MLNQGDKAPAFTLASDSGKSISLADYAGKTLIVYFYPRDNTPGCTREAIAFSGAQAAIEQLGAAVVGISKDSVASHGKFRAQHDLTIALASDPDLAVHKAFGAYGEKMMYGKKVEGVIRSTFVIDGSGTIIKVFPSVKVDGHADQVLAVLGGAGAPAKKKAAPAPQKTAPAAKKGAPAKAK